jgi:hypothetical protein
MFLLDYPHERDLYQDRLLLSRKVDHYLYFIYLWNGGDQSPLGIQPHGTPVVLEFNQVVTFPIEKGV